MSWPDLRMSLAHKIVDKQTRNLDLSMFHDSIGGKIETMISSELKGEAVLIEEKKPPAKSLMEAFGRRLNH